MATIYKLGDLRLSSNMMTAEETEQCVKENTTYKDYTAIEVFPTDKDIAAGTVDSKETLSVLFTWTESQLSTQKDNQYTGLAYTLNATSCDTAYFQFYVTETELSNNDILIDWGDGTQQKIKDASYYQDPTDSESVKVSHKYEAPYLNLKNIVRIYGQQYYMIRQDLYKPHIASRAFDTDLPISKTLTNASSLFGNDLTTEYSYKLLRVKIPETFEWKNMSNFSNLYTNCKNLLEVTWNNTKYCTVNVFPRTFTRMFLGCTNLATVGKFYIPNEFTAKNGIAQMFTFCPNLTSDIATLLDPTGFKQQYIDMKEDTTSGMFQGCSKLTGTIPSNLLWKSKTTFANVEKFFTGCSLSAQAPKSWGGTAEEPTNFGNKNLSGENDSFDLTLELPIDSNLNGTSIQIPSVGSKADVKRLVVRGSENGVGTQTSYNISQYGAWSERCVSFNDNVKLATINIKKIDEGLEISCKAGVDIYTPYTVTESYYILIPVKPSTQYTFFGTVSQLEGTGFNMFAFMYPNDTQNYTSLSSSSRLKTQGYWQIQTASDTNYLNFRFGSGGSANASRFQISNDLMLVEGWYDMTNKPEFKKSEFANVISVLNSDGSLYSETSAICPFKMLSCEKGYDSLTFDGDKFIQTIKLRGNGKTVNQNTISVEIGDISMPDIYGSQTVENNSEVYMELSASFKQKFINQDRMDKMLVKMRQLGIVQTDEQLKSLKDELYG